MSFIHIQKHDITSAYLNLDMNKSKDYIINTDNITHVEFNKKYPNGYGEHLAKLVISFVNDEDQIVLYRTDAENAYNILANEFKVNDSIQLDTPTYVQGFADGFNKANEWNYHLIPKDYTKPYLCKVIHPTKNDMIDYEILFYDENDMSWYRWLMPWDGGDLNTAVRINRKVIAWKEIISPKE